MHRWKFGVLMTAAFFLVVSAALINGQHLYYMAALLLVLPLVSYLFGMVSLRGLTFKRETPGNGWNGETVLFHLQVTSHSRLPRLSLQCRDNQHPFLVPVEETPPYLNVPPLGTVRVPYAVELRRRGLHKTDWITVTALDPLGIFAFTHRFRAPAEILVYPVPQELPEFSLIGSEKYGYRDLPIASVRGSGVDPDGVREYVPGDPLRRMHWKSTARTGKLSVIEFEESRAVNMILVLDLYRQGEVGDGTETTLEYLIRAAASFAQEGIRQGASVRLLNGMPGEGDGFAGRGTEHLYTILSQLARAEATLTEPLSVSLIKRLGVLPPGNSLVVFTAYTDAALAAALMPYTTNGTQATVVFADPRSFKPGNPFPTLESRRAYIESLAAAQADCLILNRQENQSIQLESLSHGSFYS